jgi:sarcosine oxidase
MAESRLDDTARRQPAGPTAGVGQGADGGAVPCTSANLTRSLRPDVGTTIADVAVIGGDAVGAATAWLLARRGARVVLLEERGVRAVRHAARGTAWSAHPSWIPADSRHLFGIATELWHALEAETGATLLRRADAADHGDSARLETIAAQDPAGSHEWLRPDAAAARWPGATFTTPVLYRRGAAAQIHADQAIAALTAAAAGQGAVLQHRTAVTAVDVLDADRAEIHTRAGRLCARSVVVTGPAPTGIASLDAPEDVDGPELHFAHRTDVTGGSDTTRWPLIAHHHTELGLVRAVACTRGHIAVGCHDDRHPVSPRGLQDHVRDWYPGLSARRPEPVTRAAMSTALAPVSIDRTGPVLSARSTAVGSILATALGRVLADAALADSPTPAGQW